MTGNPSICFVLVCCTFGFVVGLMRLERYQEELDAMPRNLSIFDDKGNIVNITMEEKPDDKEAKFFFNDVNFYLYTKKNPTHPQELEINNAKKLKRSYFNSKNPTRFITHGWTDSGNAHVCLLIRDAYLKLKGSKDNVIVVDWSGISQTPYIWAANNVDVVGQEVADMIDFMVEKGSLNVTDTTLVGHSLGAHVMGLAGYFSEYKIRHVVGLDPALPMFNFAEPQESISKKSGHHVQIIHTNAGITGYLNPSGHSDFYPNGGIKQPGCCDSYTPVRCTFCSHIRAVEFFAESISNPFEGVRCNNWQEYTIGTCRARGYTTLMGGPSVNLPSPGTYFFATSSAAPFSVMQ